MPRSNPCLDWQSWWTNSTRSPLKTIIHHKQEHVCCKYDTAIRILDYVLSQDQIRRSGIRWARYCVKVNSWWLLSSKFQNTSCQFCDIPLAVHWWQMSTAFHITFGQPQTFLWKLQSPRNSVTWNRNPSSVKGCPATFPAFPTRACPMWSAAGKNP